MLDYETIKKRASVSKDKKEAFKECLQRAKKLVRTNALIQCIERVLKLLD